MKIRAPAAQPLSVGERPASNFGSGEYLRPDASGARALPQGASQAELELHVERMQRRIDELECLLEERASELFLARETERSISAVLPGVRAVPAGALLTLDRSGTIATVNQAVRTLLGYTDAELVGQPLRVLLDDPDADCLIEAEALAPEGTALRTEQTWIAKSGLRVRVLFSIAALGVVDGHGQPRHFVCTAFELGARKKWETGVRQAEKLATLGRLSAGAADEIGTAMGFVTDGARMLHDSTEDLLSLLEKHRAVLRSIRAGENATDAVARAAAAENDSDLSYLIASMPKAFGLTMDGLERVRTIVRSVQEFAHSDRREVAEIDLNRAILSTLTVARNEYKHVAHLCTEFGALPPVFCHVGELNQAVLTLVVNAARSIADVSKGTDGKGRITVRTRLDGDDAIVAVTDTGAGIPEPLRGKHDGKLWFETVVGHGTTFFLRLPCGGQRRER